jgi:proteasome lid subunit RPN8/RPN11
MTRQLIIPPDLIEKMRAHVQSCLPEEACGILGGSGDLVKVVIPVTNELHSPVRFTMAPEEQFKAFMWLEENMLDMLGYYHSHPTGPDHLSETDLKQSFYPGAVLVLLFPKNQKLKWRVKGFIIEENTIKEIYLEQNEKK